MPDLIEPKEPVQLSIVVPAFNEEGHLRNLIQSVAESLNDLNHEIIVVDNGSTDATPDIASQLGVKLLQIPTSTISVARNLGIEEASAEVIAFLDADVRVTRPWAEELHRQLSRIRDDYIITGARYLIPEPPSRIEKYWFEPLSRKNVSYINGGNLIMSKTTFRRIGGFDENLRTGEDYELCSRAKHRGAEIVINRELKAIHDGFPKTLSRFCKREIWHGMGDFQGLTLFLKSKVAIAAVLFSLCHAMLFGALAAGFYSFALLNIACIIALCLAMSVKIFRASSPWVILHNMPLCYLYLASRFISLPKLLLSKFA